MDGLDFKLLWGTYALMLRGPRESSTASASMRHLRYFHFSTPTSRASSSQNFEHPLPPLLVDFVRKMQLAMLRKFPENLGRNSARNSQKFSARSFRKFSKIHFQKIPLEILRIFKVKMLKF